METVSIFIASSSRDTGHERAVVGDAVRVLNDKYEPAGFRIRLKCWEDFAPEFTGARKQTEYNEQLIKESRFFIALFRGVCGKYTQEEVCLWHSALGRIPIVLDIQDHIADKSEINAFLIAEGLTAVEVTNDDDIRSQIEAIVDGYVTSHATEKGPDTTPSKEIYATIPEDRAPERPIFGNLVRSIDDIAEQYFHYRCHLSLMDPTRIASSDYYTAILKDNVSAEEEQEVLEAIKCSVSYHLPSVMLYYNDSDSICINHPAIGGAVERHGIFSEPYDNLCRVRYNLVKWLHRQSLLRVGLSAGIDIRDGWFIFCGLPVIPLTALGITTTNVVEQSAELIKQFSFAVLGVNTAAGITVDKMDWPAMDAEIAKVDALLNASQSIVQAAKERFNELLEQVNRQIDAILSGEVDSHNILFLTGLIQRKGKLLENMSTEPRELVCAQMLIVQVHDTYPEAFAATDIDIDEQYKVVTDTADRYEIKDPTVEMMRMNYANSLGRQNRNGEALAIYELTMTNIDAFDDHSAMLRYYIIHLYVTYINLLLFLGENQRADEALARLESKETKWEGYNLSDLERISNISRILACHLRRRPVKPDVAALLNRATDVYREILKYPPEVFETNLRDELFCDLPVTIVATAIDSAMFTGLTFEALEAKVKTIINHVLEYTDQYPDDHACMTYQSNAYHNLSFFQSAIRHDQLSARQSALRALAVRRKIYEKNHYEADLCDVAQTLLMVGATYVNDLKGSLSEGDCLAALAYADECLSIYNVLNKEHYPEQQLRYYQAIQLKGSILYYGGHKDEGLGLLSEAWQWNIDHPGNPYQTIFEAVAGRVLKTENRA